MSYDIVLTSCSPSEGVSKCYIYPGPKAPSPTAPLTRENITIFQLRGHIFTQSFFFCSYISLNVYSNVSNIIFIYIPYISFHMYTYIYIYMYIYIYIHIYIVINFRLLIGVARPNHDCFSLADMLACHSACLSCQSACLSCHVRLSEKTHG